MNKTIKEKARRGHRAAGRQQNLDKGVCYLYLIIGIMDAIVKLYLYNLINEAVHYAEPR